MSLLPNIAPSKRSGSVGGMIDTLYDYVKFIEPGAIASLPQSAWGTQVAIIGAGAAGLAAAYELLKIGAQPVIFEASDRLGGRAYSRKFPNSNIFAEFGAMRFPPSGGLFFYYLNQVFGLSDRSPFPDPGQVPTRLYYENRVIDWPSGESAPRDAKFRAIGQAWSQFSNGLWQPLQEAWQSQDRDRLRQIWQSYIDRYKDLTFYEGVRQGIPHWTDEELNAFGALGIGSGGFGPVYPANFLEIFRLIANLWEDQQQFLPFGISTMMERFYHQSVTLPSGESVSLASTDAIRYRSPVTAIDLHQDQPQVTWCDRQGTPHRQQFPAVIVAIPTRAMERLGLTLSSPGIPVVNEAVKVAIRNLHTTNSSKLFIRTATKFWLDDPTLPQNIQTDELPRGVYALDYPRPYNPEDNGVILISYTWEDDSSKLLALDKHERLQRFRQAIANVSPKFADHLQPLQGEDDILCIDWEVESGYQGAFKLQYPGQDAHLHALYYQFQTALSPESDRGVYLAGDGVSWAGGWMEGALTTGINSACAAALRLGGQVRSGSPLTQNPNLYHYGDRPL